MHTNEQVYMVFCVIKQGTAEKVEVYYERILKLANCLKRNSLFEHKEVVVTCEESMGDPTKYQKFLKSNISNDGKHTDLVCS
jgi:hypothetical protein